MLVTLHCHVSPSFSIHTLTYHWQTRNSTNKGPFHVIRSPIQQYTNYKKHNHIVCVNVFALGSRITNPCMLVCLDVSEFLITIDLNIIYMILGQLQ